MVEDLWEAVLEDVLDDAELELGQSELPVVLLQTTRSGSSARNVYAVPVVPLAKCVPAGSAPPPGLDSRTCSDSNFSSVSCCSRSPPLKNLADRKNQRGCSKSVMCGVLGSFTRSTRRRS